MMQSRSVEELIPVGYILTNKKKLGVSQADKFLPPSSLSFVHCSMHGFSVVWRCFIWPKAVSLGTCAKTIDIQTFEDSVKC